MTEEQLNKFKQAAKDGSLPDEENPVLLFSTTSTNLLAKLMAKEFNITSLIRMEMQKRGVNDKGQWVGFKSPVKVKRNGK